MGDILNKKGLYFMPLGGSEQFGVNLNLYIYNGRMLAVDCGIGFADDYYPGIDILLPDPSFIEDHQDRLDGVIITHAHEDHIGGLAYLWDAFDCPVYASEFTASILKKKFDEQGIKRMRANIVQPLETVSIGDFHVKFLPVSHSVPGACALLLETSFGNVLHSGDWNLDPYPVIGPATDADLFRKIGEQGVLAYVGDSTNAGVDGRSGSEADVEKGLEAEFKACEGRIVTTIFSSNIGRIKSIVRAAQKSDRNVCVVGRSLHRMIGAAYDCGYLDDIPDFVPEKELAYLPANKIVVVATGSQGEHRSALAKISRGDFSGVSLERGDSVIFSARAIPGNEKNINQVKNNLSASGIRIVTPRDTEHVIHVSGHPCRDEIADMLSWLKPKSVVAVHGERAQLGAHAQFAKNCQVAHVIVPNNGSVARLAPGEPEVVDHVETALLALDQKRIIPVSHNSIRERRKLQYNGVLHVSLAVDAKGKVLGEPKVQTIGLIDKKDGESQIVDKTHDEIAAIIDDMTWEERLDDQFLSEELRIGLRRFMFHVLGMKPKTTIHVLRV